MVLLRGTTPRTVQKYALRGIGYQPPTKSSVLPGIRNVGLLAAQVFLSSSEFESVVFSFVHLVRVKECCSRRKVKVSCDHRELRLRISPQGRGWLLRFF